MKWRDPLPVTCPSCDRGILAGVADLRSLQATCPRCGGSLAANGEWMIAEEARLRPVIDRAVDMCQVIMYVEDHTGLAFPPGDDAVESLEDLVQVLAGRLDGTGDREARAAELVAEAARRVAPRLLSEATSDSTASG